MNFIKSVIFLICCMAIISGCSNTPIAKNKLNENDYRSALTAIQQLKNNPKLEAYFTSSVAYAVIPTATRGGFGFGAAFGNGWIFQGAQLEPIAKTHMLELHYGPHIGLQFYRQIMFFKTLKSLEQFQRGTLEFTGQANLALITLGGAATPSFNNEVALFTQLRSGLLIEASVGGQHFRNRAIE